MSDSPVAVVVDCSGATSGDVKAALDLIQEGIDLVDVGNILDGAAKIAAGNDQLTAAKVSPTSTRPLTSDELAQHTLDQQDGHDRQIADLQAECDLVLAATDWTQMADAAGRLPAGTTVKQWAEYRQAVWARKRAITDPAAPPAWPAPPALVDGLPV